MRLVPPTAFRTQPWKNGGGVTHEIARQDRGGRMAWRLSLAEVAADGPFSPFPGLSRILTVISGAGLDLETPAGVLAARPLLPVAFAGDLPVTGRLVAGPVRDVNVIWDSTQVAATVEVLDGHRPACPPRAGRLYALLALAGGAPLGIPDGAAAFADRFEPAACPGLSALCVTLSAAP